MTAPRDYQPHPRNPRTELRILRPANPGKDFMADGWAGKMVLVTGWFPSWSSTNERSSRGESIWKLHWKGKCMELPDRFFHESELERIA